MISRQRLALSRSVDNFTTHAPNNALYAGYEQNENDETDHGSVVIITSMIGMLEHVSKGRANARVVVVVCRIIPQVRV